MKRCDHLPLLDPNPGKIARLLEVLRAFRAAAPDTTADQWRRFFETGRFSKDVSASEEAQSEHLSRIKTLIGAVRPQMLRYQVVGQLESFISNRRNEFRELVVASSLDDATRHQLLTINKARAWFRREPVIMRSGALKGESIPDEIRQLARRIMHQVLSRHRRPNFSRLNPKIDQRQASLGRAETARHAPLWLSIRSMRPALNKKGQPTTKQAALLLPLQSFGYFEARGGKSAKTIELIERPASARTVKRGRATHRLADGRPGELVIGITSDMEAAFAETTAGYQPLRD